MFTKKLLSEKGKAAVVVLLVVVITLLVGCCVMTFLFIREARRNSNENKNNSGEQGCLYEGKKIEDGDKFEAADGCNSCFCEKGEVSCTSMSCLDPDETFQTSFKLVGDEAGLVSSLELTVDIPQEATVNTSLNKITDTNFIPQVSVESTDFTLYFLLMHDVEVIKYTKIEKDALPNDQFGPISRFEPAEADFYGYTNNLSDGESCDSYGGKIDYPCGPQVIWKGNIRFIARCESDENASKCDDIVKSLEVKKL